MKPIDLSKFRKGIEKTMPSISVGFKDVSTWINTGNYALNYRISGDFFKGTPLESKFTLFCGSSGSGKSLLVSGIMAKWCQDNGILPIIIDTENALDRKWMEAFDIDPDGYIMKISASLIDDIAKIMSDFIKEYKENYRDTEYEDRPKVVFIIDSLGMATTPTEVDQFQKGDMKGDMGRKPKQLFSLCRNFMASCSNEPIGLIATNHTYESQDMFNPDSIISGGASLSYTPSVIVVMEKRKLKEDENGAKTSDVKGIRVDAVVRKTRYTQPFQKISFTVPWDTGVNPYSGLFELFTESLTYKGKPIIVKEGAYCTYYDLKTGEKVWKKYRKEITGEDYDNIMKIFMEVSNEDNLVNNEGNDE